MSARLAVALKVLPHGEGLPLPCYATALSAGADLHLSEDLTLVPGERLLAPTGLAMALPAGFEGQVRPRSGLAIRLGLTVINAPGTIDADYRGELMVPLLNAGQQLIRLSRGDRIAQLVIAPIVQAQFKVLANDEILPSSARGRGGFGSTGR